MRLLAFAAASAALISAAVAPPAASAAETAAQPVIAVTGSGSVRYTPDIARESLGVRAESASAASAAGTANARAQAVINAMRKLGIADADIATSNYTIEYQPPQQPQADNGDPAPVQTQTTSTVRKPLPQGGTYVASEEIDVQNPLTKAGAVLDAAVAAGSNQINGITFDSSWRPTLYREALGRAMADARAQAEILAKAAGMSIAGVQSVSAGGASVVQPMRGVAAMALEANAPVMAGTGTVEASVEVVYRLR